MSIPNDEAGQIYESATKILRDEYGSVSEAPDLDDYIDMDITEQAEIDDNITAAIKARDYAHGTIRKRKELTEFAEEYGLNGEELTENQILVVRSLKRTFDANNDGLAKAVAESLNA
jgi:hypothetical protein